MKKTLAILSIVALSAVTTVSFAAEDAAAKHEEAAAAHTQAAEHHKAAAEAHRTGTPAEAKEHAKNADAAAKEA